MQVLNPDGSATAPHAFSMLCLKATSQAWRVPPHGPAPVMLVACSAEAHARVRSVDVARIRLAGNDFQYGILEPAANTTGAAPIRLPRGLSRHRNARRRRRIAEAAARGLVCGQQLAESFTVERQVIRGQLCVHALPLQQRTGCLFLHGVEAERGCTGQHKAVGPAADHDDGILGGDRFREHVGCDQKCSARAEDGACTRFRLLAGVIASFPPSTPRRRLYPPPLRVCQAGGAQLAQTGCTAWTRSGTPSRTTSSSPR